MRWMCSGPGRGRDSCVGKRARRRLQAGPVVVALALSALVGSCIGCSGGQPADRAATVFAHLARTATPMPVYGWTKEPEGIQLRATWLPVIEDEDPASYQGPAVSNPRVDAAPGVDPQIQVVFGHGSGWIVVVENFRGDLGDVTGREVGAVGGHGASLYEDVNGGNLVQWSDGGRWYGLFGRGVPTEELVPLALTMTLISGGSGG